MRAATGFHADQAGLEVREEVHHVLALELLAQSHLPMPVDSVHLEDYSSSVRTRPHNTA